MGQSMRLEVGGTHGAEYETGGAQPQDNGSLSTMCSVLHFNMGNCCDDSCTIYLSIILDPKSIMDILWQTIMVIFVQCLNVLIETHSQCLAAQQTEMELYSTTLR